MRFSPARAYTSTHCGEGCEFPKPRANDMPITTPATRAAAAVSIAVTVLPKERRRGGVRPSRWQASSKARKVCLRSALSQRCSISSRALSSTGLSKCSINHCSITACFSGENSPSNQLFMSSLVMCFSWCLPNRRDADAGLRKTPYTIFTDFSLKTVGRDFNYTRKKFKLERYNFTYIFSCQKCA